MNPAIDMPIIKAVIQSSDLLRENDMKTLTMLIATASLALAAAAHAEDSGNPPAVSQAAEQPKVAPHLSDLPMMKAEGERIAALMEKLAKESDPAERRRIMSELTCAQ
jgi:hypothetical protein